MKNKHLAYMAIMISSTTSFNLGRIGARFDKGADKDIGVKDDPDHFFAALPPDRP